MRAALAFLSGAVALVYQVVWTREVALLAGSQIQALSVVVAAYFGGLALGSRFLGPIADRAPAPLRFYAWLELLAGALAIACLLFLRAMPALHSTAVWLAIGGGAVLLVTLPLGGTLPALVRDSAGSGTAAARSGGLLLAANTLGAMAGVALAIACIPVIGLSATLHGAAAAGLVIGAAAWLLANPRASSVADDASGELTRVPREVLARAFVLGAAALGFEMLATRLAGLLLGSSLMAWGLVLALFLGGLTGGYTLASPRAATSAAPRRELGVLAIAAGCLLALGLIMLRPELTRSAPGVSFGTVLRVALAVLPTTCLMGATFPYLVRLGVGSAVAGGWGAVSAWNTGGGIVGALVAPMLLLPALGPLASAWGCAALDVAVGASLLLTSVPRGRVLLGAGIAAFALMSSPLLRPITPGTGTLLLAALHGPQATVAVTSRAGHRTMLVDGDPEAASVGPARQTEELLAALPLLLHREPRHFLEVGLGSGITLATATRFPLDTAECVEIAPSVLRAAPYFAPANEGALDGDAATIHIGDARIFLAQRVARYDVIAANTVHPWSLGATGLYSREYFERIAAALRPGGLAAQWLPVQRVGPDALAAMLRTFFAVFEHGAVWWGANNLLLVGSHSPLAPISDATFDARLRAANIAPQRLGLRGGSELRQRRLATADSVRRALGAGLVLEDDRPALERLARSGEHGEALVLVQRLAAEQSAIDPAAAGIHLWLEAETARARGETARADGRERLAINAGFVHARRARAARRVLEGYAALAQGNDAKAEFALRAALLDDPLQRDARFGLAGVLLRSEQPEPAVRELETLLTDHEDDPEAWNELANAYLRSGDRDAARQAARAALRANPYYPEALANAGLLALRAGDSAAAEAHLERLSRLPASPASAALESAMEAQR